MISTGIKKLDSIMGGGFPKASTILIKGPTGSGKSTFCQYVLSHGLQKSESGIYVALDSLPEEIIDAIESKGMNVRKFLKEGKFYFLDAYSWKIGGGKPEPWKKIIRGGLDVNALNIGLSELLKKTKGFKRLVFDSISTLLLYIPSDVVVRFVPIMIAKGKQSNSTQLLILEEGVHQEQTVNTLSYLADGLIEFKMDGDKKFLRISKMRGAACKREWMQFSLTKNGIKLKE